MIVRRNAQLQLSVSNPYDEEDVFLAKLRMGEHEAVARFVEEHRQRIFSFVYSVLMNKEDAEDVTQETLIRALDKIDTFNGDSTLTTWVLRIGRNAALDLRRKKSRSERASIVSLRELGSSGLGESESGTMFDFSSRLECPSELLQVREKLSLVNSILTDISREHREVLILREVDGLSYDEIADVVGVSRGTVMSRLFYARKRVQQALEAVKAGSEQEVEEAGNNADDEAERDDLQERRARNSRFSFGRFAGLGLF
jgi:RNA polymerase sigma-70 factor, ECF subfamily